MKNVASKGCIFAIVLLVILPGCWRKKKIKAEEPKRTTASVNIPTNDSTAPRSFFDENLGEFVAQDDATDAQANTALADAGTNDYAWMDEANNDGSFKSVRFGFDKYKVSEDQRPVVAADAQAAKDALEKNPNAVIVVEGHACSSAGSAVYNFAIGEKRSKAVSDDLVNAGVDAEHLKLVSRGMEVPVMIDGQPVSGSRDEQAPNRRVEFLVVNS